VFLDTLAKVGNWKLTVGIRGVENMTITLQYHSFEICLSLITFAALGKLGIIVLKRNEVSLANK
jgi:hypothetical protein